MWFVCTVCLFTQRAYHFQKEINYILSSSCTSNVVCVYSLSIYTKGVSFQIEIKYILSSYCTEFNCRGANATGWRHYRETFAALLARCEREFAGHQWISRTRGQWCSNLMSPLMSDRTNCWWNTREAGELMCLDAHLSSLYWEMKILLMIHRGHEMYTSTKLGVNPNSGVCEILNAWKSNVLQTERMDMWKIRQSYPNTP